MQELLQGQRPLGRQPKCERNTMKLAFEGMVLVLPSNRIGSCDMQHQDPMNPYAIGALDSLPWVKREAFFARVTLIMTGKGEQLLISTMLAFCFLRG